ncbi:hypothetical protein LX81_03371 [Palleronia aestuarii]|uniref:Uncharacterized protein n=1 Tax=Palleronia aestuarii TaxID=568105 RepID=A0A2W7N805_9RHOB|nr:hypothetical protein [Palleronia aestuarii]PZX12994.1 hypothetical protein LX81_03371 [Palleronia aestuarii]
MTPTTTKRTMRAILFGLGTAAMTAMTLATALPAAAQSADPTMDEQSETQLQKSIGDQLAARGIEVEVETLSANQLAEIQGLLGRDDSESTNRIEEIINQ